VVVEGNPCFPEAALGREFLTFSNHRTRCAWKGEARHHSLLVNGELNPDAVWYYPPPPGSGRRHQGPRRAFWKGVQVVE
jgi:uncharacterized protein (DUF427 family)